MARRSSITRHRRRADIEHMIDAKVPYREIGERYKISIWAVFRHRQKMLVERQKLEERANQIWPRFTNNLGN